MLTQPAGGPRRSLEVSRWSTERPLWPPEGFTGCQRFPGGLRGLREASRGLQRPPKANTRRRRSPSGLHGLWQPTKRPRWPLKASMGRQSSLGGPFGDHRRLLEGVTDRQRSSAGLHSLWRPTERPQWLPNVFTSRQRSLSALCSPRKLSDNLQRSQRPSRAVTGLATASMAFGGRPKDIGGRLRPSKTARGLRRPSKNAKCNLGPLEISRRPVWIPGGLRRPPEAAKCLQGPPEVFHRQKKGLLLPSRAARGLWAACLATCDLWRPPNAFRGH